MSVGSGQIGQAGLLMSGQTGSVTQVKSVASEGSGQIGHKGLSKSGH